MQRSTRSTSVAPAPAAACSAAVQRSSLPLLTMLRPYRSRNLLGHLLPHLVAAGSDRRADDRLQARSQRAARRPRRRRRSGPATRRARRPAPVGPRSCERGPRARSRPRARASGCPAHRSRGRHPGPLATRLRSVDDRRVRLEADRELRPGPRRSPRTGAAGSRRHARDVVARLAAEIEGLERAHADTAASSREDDLAAGRIPAEDRNRHDCSTSSRAAASSDSLPSSSPFSFRAPQLAEDLARRAVTRRGRARRCRRL